MYILWVDYLMPLFCLLKTEVGEYHSKEQDYGCSSKCTYCPFEGHGFVTWNWAF